MADFRKWILALSVLALVFAFTGVASAQGGVGGEGTNLVCTAGTAVPPQIRTEGLTELVGDITLVCTGGTVPAAVVAGTAPVPQANIVVNLGGAVTSRLIGNGGNSNASEALLLIDEPGAAGLTGVGPYESQYLCPTPSTGCQAWYGTVTNAGGTAPDITTTAGGTIPAANVYQGVITGTYQVTFFGVPILAPVTAGTARVLRITNLRVNGYSIESGGSAFEAVFGQISVNNVQVSVTNPQVTVGYVQQSFAGSFNNGSNSGALSTTALYQCDPLTDSRVAVLRFSELFGTAFKTRVNGGGVYPGTVSATAIQNVPGAIYNSESGFVSAFSGNASGVNGALVSSNGFEAGLADYGTRLKATFANLPAGVSVYVSTVNLIGADGTAGQPSTTGVNFATGGSPEYALLVSSENGVDNPIPTVTPNAYTDEWQLPVSSTGTSEAVWEVVQALSNTTENFDFGLYVTFSNTVAPSPSGITVTLSYAPTPTNAGGPSATLTIPRFAPENPTSSPILSLNLCTTALLFPYVTTVTGYDTGIAISNTTSDPFNTPNQAGTCEMYWYGGPPGATTAATPVAPTVLGAGGVNNSTPILTGTTALTIASQSTGVGFSGYMIALCNFQYAHGYANVTDVGVRNIMSSYLALVITDRAYAGGFNIIEALNN